MTLSSALTGTVVTASSYRITRLILQAGTNGDSRLVLSQGGIGDILGVPQSSFSDNWVTNTPGITISFG